MAYSSSGKLPYEVASKLGHLNVVKSEWVQSLLNDLETDDLSSGKIFDNLIWNEYELGRVKPLKYIWIADGSYVSVVENRKEVAFVKTALMTVDRDKVSKIDKDYPHPLFLQEIMRDSALFHATVFPLKNLKSEKGNIYNTVRHIIYDSMKVDEGGEYFETLKWLSYRKWEKAKNFSPSFECPCCGEKIESGFPYDLDSWNCPKCNNEIFLTDMLGFHLDMNEDNAEDSVASTYMLIMEMLMLFTIIRLQWKNRDQSIVSETLFIKDGPMTLGKQYSKLVPNIRAFFLYAKQLGRPVHIMSGEKSGKYFDYLSESSRFVENKENVIKYAVLNHGYIRKEIQRAPQHINPYGYRTNWGEKVFVVLDPHTHFVLNMTTGTYEADDNYPTESDIIGLERILETLPALVSRKYEGALYPVELVNGISSMSNYPSAKILKDFLRNVL